MKNTTVLLSFTLLAAASCGRHCLPVTLSGIDSRGTNLVTDTAVQITRAKAGSNFTTGVDITYEKVRVFPDSQIKIGAPNGSFRCDMSDAGKDYKFVLLPSGKVHTITNIDYGDERVSGGGNTTCSFHYKLDGELTGEASKYYNNENYPRTRTVDMRL